MGELDLGLHKPTRSLSETVHIVGALSNIDLIEINTTKKTRHKAGLRFVT
jgi:hypothetical protein